MRKALASLVRTQRIGSRSCCSSKLGDLRHRLNVVRMQFAQLIHVLQDGIQVFFHPCALHVSELKIREIRDIRDIFLRDLHR